MRFSKRISKMMLPLLLMLLLGGLVIAQEGEGSGQGGGSEASACTGSTYTVQYGDTLDEIAQCYDVSLQSLMLTNNIRFGYELKVGMVLSIPVDGAAYGEVPPLNPDGSLAEGIGGGGGDDLYVVQPGDTLDGIAQQYNISLISLSSANPEVRAANLRPGTVLTIPTDAPPYGVVPPLNPDGSVADGIGGGGGTEGTLYVVQPGDTLDTIAQEFNVSVIVLRLVNGIGERDRLFPGTVLTIPDDAVAYGEVPPLNPDGSLAEGIGGGGGDGEVYVVQPGDTLDGIAQQFNISLISLQLANGIDNPSVLRPGTVLSIPAGAPPYGTFPPLNPDGSLADGIGGGGGDGDVYVVQPGDTLDGVAQQYNISLIYLREINNLVEGAPLIPGTILNIPANAPAYGVVPPLNPDGSLADGIGGGGGSDGAVYVVQPGDTLDGIAQTFNVSVIALQAANGITNAAALSPGTVLTIPDGPAYGEYPALDAQGNLITDLGGGGGNVYIVQPGDYLNAIAESFNVDAACLAAANELEGVTIFPGQVLMIDATCPSFGG